MGHLCCLNPLLAQLLDQRAELLLPTHALEEGAVLEGHALGNPELHEVLPHLIFLAALVKRPSAVLLPLFDLFDEILPCTGHVH